MFSFNGKNIFIFYNILNNIALKSGRLIGGLASRDLE